MKRRNIIKGLSLLPLGSLVPLKAVFAAPGIEKGLAIPELFEGIEAGEAGPLVIGKKIFQSIGVEPIINCRGTFTIIGGQLKGRRSEQLWKLLQKTLCNMMN